MINDEPWHHLTDHKQDISLMLTQVHHHSCCSAEPEFSLTILTYVILLPVACSVDLTKCQLCYHSHWSGLLHFKDRADQIGSIGGMLTGSSWKNTSHTVT